MKDLDFLCKVEGLKVTFQVLSRIPANAVVSWNFGDGTDAYNQARVTHQYGEMGIYPIDLTVETSGGTYGKGAKVLMLSTITKTHLSDSIYNLINEYIPHEISEGMTSSQKSVFINKWQLYIQPLVSRSRGKEIPIDEYNNELYYEGLENQLIMELAAWDFLNVTITNLLTGSGEYLRQLVRKSNNEDDESYENTRGDRVKKITTGPTEVEYYDSLSESISALYKSYTDALKPGGVMDELRKNLCMLASRLEIFLPFCTPDYHITVPKVVNRRNPGPLGGPNPTSPLNGGVTIKPLP